MAATYNCKLSSSLRHNSNDSCLHSKDKIRRLSFVDRFPCPREVTIQVKNWKKKLVWRIHHKRKQKSWWQSRCRIILKGFSNGLASGGAWWWPSETKGHPSIFDGNKKTTTWATDAPLKRLSAIHHIDDHVADTIKLGGASARARADDVSNGG